MKRYIAYSIIAGLGMALTSCEPEFEKSVEDGDFYTSGEADFSTYVALGNSLTAGYADNALYRAGQENSFPNILSQQFEFVGGGEFTQPLVADNIGGLLLNGQQIAETRLILDVNESGSPAPTPIGGEPSTEISSKLGGSYNNMGVPGAKSFHLVVPGYGNVQGVIPGQANPYYARFASSAQSTVLEDAVSQNPTFFSLWIGNNDVLGYATSGGVGVNQTGNLDPTTYGPNDITDPNVFASVVNTQVEALMQSASGGVMLNIPDVTTVPYFTAVPYNPLTPAALGDQLQTANGLYAQLNQAFAALGVPERAISFSEDGPSGVVVQDESLENIGTQLTQLLVQLGFSPTEAALYGQQFGQARQANENDLLVLTSSSVIGQVNMEYLQSLVGMGVPQEQAALLSINGVSYPMQDQYVLLPSEQQEVMQMTAAYNATLAGIAQANGLAFVDANALLSDVADGGIAFDGGVITAEFATGGAFSLDGIHLTPRGYAVVANRVIEAVNQTYKASIPVVNIGDFRGDPAIGSGSME